MSCPTLFVLEKQKNCLSANVNSSNEEKQKRRHLVIFSLESIFVFGVKALKQIISGKSMFCTVCLLHCSFF